MISKLTIFSLLVALLIGLGIHAWAASHLDECDKLGAGIQGTEQYVNVKTGTRVEATPCSIWIPRQPLPVQAAWLLDLAAAVVFLVSLFTDWQRWSQRRNEGLQ